MGLLASLFVRIGAQTAEYDKALNSASSRIKKFGSEMADVGSRLTMGISTPLLGLGLAAVKSAGDMEALKAGLTSVTGSAVATEAEFKQLQEVAKLPGLGMEEAVRGAVNLQAIGFSADRTKQILLQFGNALATVGRGREDLEEVIRQLGQLASRGKVTADNLKPIMERVPQVAAIIKREFGTIDTEVLQKMGVSSEQMVEVFIRELGKLPRVAGGIKNDFENLRDAIQQSMAKVGEIFAPLAKRFIDEFAAPALDWTKKLADGFQGLSPQIQTLALALGGIAIAAPPVIWGFGQIASAVGGVGAAVARLAPMLANPYVLAILGIGGAIAGGVYMYQSLSRTNDELDAAYAKLERGGKAAQEWGQWSVEAGKAASSSFGITVKVLGEVSGGADQAAEKFEQVKLKATSLRDVLNEIEQSHAAQKLEADFIASLRAADEWNKALEGGAAHLASIYDLPESPPLVTGFGVLAEHMERISDITTDLSQKLTDIPLPIPVLIPEDNRSESERALDSVIKKADELGQEVVKNKPKVIDFGRQVSTIFTDLSSALADSILGVKSWGDAFKAVGKAVVRMILEDIIKNAMGKLMTSLAGLMGNLGSVGKAIGSIFGTSGGGAVGAVTGAAGSAASGVSGAAGSGASAAASSALGWANLAASVAGSIVSAVQMHGIGKDTGKIEENTRYTYITLRDTLARANEFWPQLNSIQSFLWNTLPDWLNQITWGIQQIAANPAAAGAGGSGAVFQFVNCTFSGGITQDQVNKMFETAARSARARTGQRN